MDAQEVRPVGTEFEAQRRDGDLIIVTYWRVTGRAWITPREGGDGRYVETVEMVGAPCYERATTKE